MAMMLRRCVLPVAAGLIVVLLAAVLPGFPALGDVRRAARVSTGVADSVGVEEAQSAARRDDRRVEAMALRTETRQVFANPDGTFTSETSALPERVRRGQDWVPVDTTLRKESDGSIRTVATPLELVFSGGGNAALARIGDGARSVEMSWPGPLPEPVLDGSTATYPEVLPGVDLKITAWVLGYSEVLVVKTREAAKNQALRKLRFGTRVTGVTLRETDTGGIEAVTSAGTPVFHSPTPMMWDSSGGVREDVRMQAVSPPVDGRRAAMGVEVTPGQVAVLPDPALLTGSEVEFPVYIDPQWSGAKQAWTYVDRAFPQQEYWNSGHQPEAGNYGGGVKRSFWRMDSDNVNGKHILKATFRITQDKSWGCTSSPQAVELWLTGGISTATTWAKQPAWRERLDTVASDAGYSSSCPDESIEFDVTSAVTSAAASGWSSTTFGMRDGDDIDSSTYGWKGFQNYPRLVIDYNTRPAVPTGIGTSPGTPCATGAGRPYVNAGDAANRLRLKARIYDPDKTNDQVRAEFSFRRLNPDTQQWEDRTSTLPGDGKTGYVASSQPVDRELLLPVLANGWTYSYRVRSYDGTDASAWTGWCEFAVDTTDPATLPQVASPVYPPDTPDDWKGGVGSAGAFTFTPGTGDTDVAGFRYALDEPALATPATQVAIPAGQTSVTVQIAPRHDWLNTLYVFPVDRAGNVGQRYATYDFYVQAGRDAVGRWRLDETSGTGAADSAGANPVTLAGGVRWTGGRVGGALQLDGATVHGTTAGPAVRTDAGFTVAAWARLENDGVDSTVLSQAGTRASGFQLSYSAADQRWVFNRHATDTDDTQIVRAMSNTAPRLRVWTHLVGVYDAPARQLRLYVNGVLQSTAAFTAAPWHAAGAFQVGRVRYQGAYGGHFAGRLDDLQVWDRILSDHPRTVNDLGLTNEIAALATQPPTQLAWWKLDETAGTAAADSAGTTPATLSGGATWTGDGLGGGGALRLNGTDGFAGTGATPVLRTDRSYAVAAWVRLADPGDGTTVPSRTATALSQDGSVRSAFFLGLRSHTKNGVWAPYWSLSAVRADVAQGTEWLHVTSAEPVDSTAIGTWVHLAAVHDEPAGRLRLYVNGQLEDQLPFAGWHGGGGLQIGRAKSLAGLVDHWPGDIDDVRVFTGTLTDRQVADLAAGATTGA
ncbi:LamG-like jellyroll fold domain-containing protein [Nonomuraea jiangxiensis]|uniref:Concanavalin A-like lectin/glucanases superfamily protein n=1 Tax=Nonomuraea jiangxiensis TaxID=633440 RepID=A0A1G9UG33_9ACTN|nr:LamG-like jellyroll fold domain-containing protein [Nonomuraea jiangxiensis]SDM58724.1 Concanavalin A-like lectin/glucanases superfamily protein [Nonomuraea jiangxiensis]